MKKQTFYKIDDNNDRHKYRRAFAFFENPPYESCMVVYSRESYEIFCNRGFDLDHYSNSDLVPVELRRATYCSEQAKLDTRLDDEQNGHNNPRVMISPT